MVEGGSARAAVGAACVLCRVSSPVACSFGRHIDNPFMVDVRHPVATSPSGSHPPFPVLTVSGRGGCFRDLGGEAEIVVVVWAFVQIVMLSRVCRVWAFRLRRLSCAARARACAPAAELSCARESGLGKQSRRACARVRLCLGRSGPGPYSGEGLRPRPGAVRPGPCQVGPIGPWGRRAL